MRVNRRFLGILLLVGWALPVGLGWGGAVQAAEVGRALNVIVVLVDDLGWADLGCYGSTFHRTPNLDRLAGEGVRFTQAYSACTVCSPTRASLLTGQYPARLHITDWIAGHKRPHGRLSVPDWTLELSPALWNLAQGFKERGYATASIGKWHLGPESSYPEKVGFDLNVGGTSRGQPPSYFSPYGIATLTNGPAGEFLTDREAEEACGFIRRNATRPFFLYLPHHAVHTPLMGKKEVVGQYRARVDSGNGQRHPVYGALLESVDDSMGRIRKELDVLRIADRTVIVFTSDNGGLVLGGSEVPTSNAPLRSGKGSPYEGGVRVQLIVYWPGVTKPGWVTDAQVITPDLTVTLVEGFRLKPATGTLFDGRSVLRELRGGKERGVRSLYWHYPHYHPGGATPYGAMRRGDYKLIEYFEDGRLELFDLKRDPGEKMDLSEEESGRAERMRRELERWREKVDAQMPEPNPAYDARNDKWQ